MAEKLIRRVVTTEEEYLDSEPQPEPEVQPSPAPPRRPQVEDLDFSDRQPQRPQPPRRR